MDVEFLSRMIGELILDHDSLSLPGLGTFVAENMPASFSDRGYTINPPYRRLSFIEQESSDGLLAQLYASDNGIADQEAEAILEAFLNDLKDLLQLEKTVEFPGLGRLRATRENHFFFVPDEDLDIYPDAFGLGPVSLKSHRTIDLPDLQDVSAPAESPVSATPQAVSPESDGAPASASEPEPLAAAPAPAPEPEPVAAAPASASEPEPLAAAPAPASQPEPVAAAPASASEPEPVAAAPAPAPEPAPTATSPQPVAAAPAPEPTAPAAAPQPAAAASTPARPRRRALRVAAWAAGAAAAMLLAFVLVSRLAPGSTDGLLYTQEELAIINAPEDGPGLPR